MVRDRDRERVTPTDEPDDEPAHPDEIPDDTEGPYS